MLEIRRARRSTARATYRAFRKTINLGEIGVDVVRSHHKIARQDDDNNDDNRKIRGKYEGSLKGNHG